MKVIHIESGLGNQMLSFCEFLAIKKMNPDDDCYIETMVYDIPECNETICQWNGYELERVFGIKAPNIKSLFSEDIWASILDSVKSSEFWNKNWNWPVYISDALNKAGLKLDNPHGDLEQKRAVYYDKSLKYRLYNVIKKSRTGFYVRRLYNKLSEGERIKACDNRSNLWVKSDKDLLTGQWLSFKYRGNDIELLHDEIENAFQFPPLQDERSIKFAAFLDSCNSVFIHARRGDMLSANGWCYKYGYFRRAVNYIRKHVENPVFVFFTNTGSIEWCKENARIFGLNYNKDQVYFVDWNVGEESYRDMQLMAHCKHGIITNSTFGWWGAYFIKNPNKITISPDIYINTTHHC